MVPDQLAVRIANVDDPVAVELDSFSAGLLRTRFLRSGGLGFARCWGGLGSRRDRLLRREASRHHEKREGHRQPGRLHYGELKIRLIAFHF